jgi:nucleotide-binding universal stress UspA family protein
MSGNKSLITVGVDGSEGGRRALAWAVRHAATTGSDVEVITAWSWDGMAFAAGAVGGPEETQAYALRVNRSDIEKVLGEFDGPAPAVIPRVIEGNATKVLTEAAKASGLLVVGSPGRGYLAKALMGSVSDASVRRRTSPVLIVPPRDQDLDLVGATAGAERKS